MPHGYNVGLVYYSKRWQDPVEHGSRHTYSPTCTRILALSQPFLLPLLTGVEALTNTRSTSLPDITPLSSQRGSADLVVIAHLSESDHFLL